MTSVGPWVSLVRVETTVRETYEREAGKRKRALTFKTDREFDSSETWMFTDGGAKGWCALVVLRPGEDARLASCEVQTDTRNVGAEVAGVVRALEAIVPGERVTIVSDFLWTIYYVLGWHAVNNRLLADQVATARALITERRPASLRYIHVKGHVRDASGLGRWNDVADRLCGLSRAVDVALPTSAFGPPGTRLNLTGLLAEQQDQ
jgi:hypothetical protein